MAKEVYPFIKISNEIYRPWIPIRIIHSKDNRLFIDMMALLDTGADHCVFPKLVTDQTKLNLKDDALSTEIMQGLGETQIEVWKHAFRIELQTPDRKGIFWKSKEIIVGCVEHDNIPPILGFSNFMCDFKITFNHATRKVLIDNSPKI